MVTTQNEYLLNIPGIDKGKGAASEVASSFVMELVDGDDTSGNFLGISATSAGLL